MLLNVSIIVNLALLLGVTSVHSINTKKQVWDGYVTRINNVAADRNDARAAALAAIHGFSNRDASFVPQLTGEGAELLFLTASGARSLNSYRKGESGTAKKFGELIGQHLKGDELANASNDVCVGFSEAIETLRDSTKVPEPCLSSFFENLERGNLNPKVLTGLRGSWISNQPEQVGRALAGFVAKFFQRKGQLFSYKSIPISAWEMGVGKSEEVQKAFCEQALHAIYLESLTDAQLSAIGPACMASIRGLDMTDLKNLEKFSSNVFSLYNGSLTKLTTFRLTEKQLVEFSRSSDEDHCQHLNLAQLNPAVAHAISPKCLEGRITNDSSEIGKNLAMIPESTFSGWKDRSALALFNVKDWRYLGHKVLETILKDGEIVSRLPQIKEEVGLLNRNTAARITLNKTELKALADACPSLASEIILANVDLPGDSLAFFEIENIESMIAFKNDIITGFEVFKIIVSQKNGRELILHMGESADNNWCGTISDVQSFKDKTWLAPNLSDKCRNELPFRNSPEAARQIPQLAKKNEELVESVLAEYDERRWASVEPGFFAALASSPTFCKALADPQHAKILEQLGSPALAMINAQCAVQMKAVITPALAPKLGVNAFALMKHADMVTMKLTLKHLTSAQIPFVSAFLSSAEQSEGYFAKVDAASIEELDNVRFNAISSKQWGMVSVEVIKAVFTASRIVTMSPSVLSHINDKQLEAMDLKTLAAFTQEQLIELGKAVDAELKAFDKIKDQLDAVRANAIKTRRDALAATKKAAPVKEAKDEAAPTQSSSNSIWLIVGGAAVIVIIAGVIFIIVRRN